MQWCLKLPASRLFIQSFIRAEIKENIKAPRHWPLCGEFTGDWWIPPTKGQWRGKYFHLMTSSWDTTNPATWLLRCLKSPATRLLFKSWFRQATMETWKPHITCLPWSRYPTGLQGKLFKPFFNLFWNAQKTFFPNYHEKPFLVLFLGPLKLPWNALFRACISKKFPGGGGGAPAALRALPYPPHMLHCIVPHRFVPSCPTQKFLNNTPPPKKKIYIYIYKFLAKTLAPCKWPWSQGVPLSLWAYFNGLILRLKNVVFFIMF